MSMQIIQHPTEFHVNIGYGRMQNYNTVQIKKLDGSRFDWVRKTWIVPARHVDALKVIKVRCRAEWEIYAPNKPQIIGEIKPLPELTYNYQLKQGSFRPYQRQGIARGLELKRYLVGDEQRLGKTLQTIGTLMIASEMMQEIVFPALFIVPSGLKLNWQGEWDHWVGKKPMILDDKVKNTWHRFYELGMNDVFITNPESLKKFFVKSMPPKGKLVKSTQIILDDRISLFKSVVIDESHRFKEPSAQQTKIAFQIARGKEWVILLSGTIIKNKPIDLFPQLAIINRLNEFGGRKGFLGRYCEGGRGASNLQELNYLLNERCFFRRERKDVLENLPEKQRQTILCDITTREEYNRAQADFSKWLKDNGCTDTDIARKMRGEIMVKMQSLKKISALGKLNEVKEYIKETTENGEKIVIFCVLHEIVDELKKAFPGALSITGRENDHQKEDAKDKFQACKKCGVRYERHGSADHDYILNEHQILICNIQAAGVGHNFSAAHETGFIEYPWSASECFQCEDRIFDSQKDNHMVCTYFLGHKTIDEENYELIKSKAGISNQITGSTDDMATEFIDRIINLFR